MKVTIFLISFLLHGCWSLPSSFLVKSPAAVANRKLFKRQASDEKNKVRITEMTVTSQIQFRYSRTEVKSLVKNFGEKSNAAKFTLVLPDTAFISNFSMVSGGVEYVADVKAKDDAREVFEKFANEGYDVGLVEKKSRDANVFQIQSNVAPAGKVLFKLTYDELLQRKLGHYEQAIHVQPGQIVDNFNIIVNINESLPVIKLSVPEFMDSNEIDFTHDKSVDSISTVVREIDGDSTKAKVVLDITSEYQKSFGVKGIQGEFLIKYDVDRKNQSHEVQVIDGHFVHFFTPENLKTLPKHIIFVLDVSGSMSGEKMEQLKDAMFTILDEMTDEDQFDIVTFSSGVEHWKPDDDSSDLAFKASKGNKDKGIKKILKLEANGGTNINDALQKAISIASLSRQKEVVRSGSTTMILFMTDGEPTEGKVNRNDIMEELKAKNRDLQVPIFSLAFGANAQFDLMVDIAKATNSHAKQIYEGSDAALQLEGFYQEISSPLLSDLKFNYVGAAVDNKSLTNTELKTFFKGEEYIISGKILPVSNPSFDIVVEGSAGSDKFEEIFSICLPSGENKSSTTELPILPSPPCYKPPQQNRSKAQIFLRNLYAFLSIKQLLEKEDELSKEKALTMSLDNYFVTDLTSLVVTKENDTAEGLLKQASSTGSNILQSSYFSSFPSVTRLASSQSYYYLEYDAYDQYDADIDYMQFQSNLRGTTTTFRTTTTTTTTTYRTTTTSTFRTITTTTKSTAFKTTFTTTITPTGSTTTTTAAISTGPMTSTTSITTECKLTLFSKTYHRGDKSEVSQSTPNLSEFNDQSVSAKLDGPCSWGLYADVGFAGEFVILTPGLSTYTSVTSLGNLLRRVKSVKKMSSR